MLTLRGLPPAPHPTLQDAHGCADCEALRLPTRDARWCRRHARAAIVAFPVRPLRDADGRLLGVERIASRSDAADLRRPTDDELDEEAAS